MYSKELYDQAVALRRAGKSLNEISRELGIAKSTASLWLRTVEVMPEGRERLNRRIRIGQEALLKHAGKRFARHRQAAYERGLATTPSPIDALCLGLYWGEGSKYSRRWSFTNSDLDMIAEMVRWAIRAGQAPGAFRAGVQTHPEDTVTEDEVRAYWSQAGIPPENIRIYRIRSRTSNLRCKGRILYGTCRLYPLGDAVALYEYYRGQRDQLLGTGSRERGTGT